MARDAKGVELACSFCDKRQPAVKLIAGPGIVICSECVARCREIARRSDSGEQATAGLAQVPDEGSYSWQFFRKKPVERPAEPMCSFCGRSHPVLVQPPTTISREGLICNECLRLCEEVVSWRPT